MINDEKEILKRAVTLLDKKKANDIVVMNIENLTILTRYFVVCTGTSSTQINALADEIREKMAVNVVRVEGKEASGWIIIDLGGVMVHIFSRKMRDFYALEHLWEGAENIPVDELIDKEENSQDEV